jgi:hypothetical protein
MQLQKSGISPTRSPKTLAKASFFTFFVGATDVTHRHFKNTLFTEKDLGSNFRFNAEIVALKWNTFDDFGAESLIAGFHIRNPTVK